MSSSRKRNSTAIVAAILLGLLFIPSVGQAERKFFPASANGVPGRYGVALMLGQTASAAPELVGSVGGRLGQIYRYIFSGFEADLAILCRSNPWPARIRLLEAIASTTGESIAWTSMGYRAMRRLAIASLPGASRST